jgi:hypothetical protein
MPHQLHRMRGVRGSQLMRGRRLNCMSAVITSPSMRPGAGMRATTSRTATEQPEHSSAPYAAATLASARRHDAEVGWTAAPRMNTPRSAN